MSDIEMTLTRDERDAVRRQMAESGNLALHEQIRQVVTCDRPNVAAERANEFPTWTAEQIQAYDLFEGVGHDWLVGVARRIVFNDPCELIQIVSVHERVYWLLCGNADPKFERNAYTDVWEVLRALAVGDSVIARRFAETGLFPLQSGHPDVVVLYNAVYGVLRRDSKYLKTIKPTLATRKAPKWISAMYSCLRGICDNSPQMVADGLENVLRLIGRTFRINPLEKKICLEAHGLYELSRWVSPQLVKQFDTSRPLPWDTSLSEAVRVRNAPLDGLDLEGLPENVLSALCQLQQPSWWNAPKETKAEAKKRHQQEERQQQLQEATRKWGKITKRRCPKCGAPCPEYKLKCGVCRYKIGRA